MGAATSTAGNDEHELLRQADIALDAVKVTAPGGWLRYEPAMTEAVAYRTELRAALRHAIDDGSLVLEYQPILSLATMRTVGFEGLVRWRHPTRGLLPPAEFIEIAEDSDLIHPIGERILTSATTAAGRWSRRDTANQPYVAVNVSVRQFRSRQFVDAVHRIVDRAGIPSNRLVLEITEGLLLRDDDDVWTTSADCAARASASRLTISAPATPPSDTCGRYPWTSSNLTAYSSAPWSAPAANEHSSAGSSDSPTRSALRQWRRASKRYNSATYAPTLMHLRPGIPLHPSNARTRHGTMARCRTGTARNQAVNHHPGAPVTARHPGAAMPASPTPWALRLADRPFTGWIGSAKPDLGSTNQPGRARQRARRGHASATCLRDNPKRSMFTCADRSMTNGSAS